MCLAFLRAAVGRILRHNSLNERSCNCIFSRRSRLASIERQVDVPRVVRDPIAAVSYHERVNIVCCCIGLTPTQLSAKIEFNQPPREGVAECTHSFRRCSVESQIRYLKGPSDCC